MSTIFPAGKPVSGHMLIGRDHLLDELDNILEIGQSVVLIAPRRYGKTSVALELLKRFSQRGHFVSEIDLFDITDKRHFAEKIIESCLKNNPVPAARYWHKLKQGALNVLSMLKFKPSLEDMELVLQLNAASVNEDKLFDRALDFSDKFSGKHKKRMIMFIDEFQDVIRLGGLPFLKQLRARFQRHSNVTYIFAGSQESIMTDLFQSRQHAFYRFGRLVEIGVISEDDFGAYITKSFKHAGINAGAEDINNILDITGGHPYYTQLFCQMIYINCLKNKADAFDKAYILKAKEQILEHDGAYFDEVWRELGDKRYARNILSAISQEKSPYFYKDTTKENIARILGDLVYSGYIQKSGKGRKTLYKFKDAFFESYVFAK